MAGGTSFTQYNNWRRFVLVLVLFLGTVALKIVLDVKKNDNDATSLKNKKSSSWKFQGDVDPTLPVPWATYEKKWWNLHRILVQVVKASDKEQQQDETADASQPQLVFYGDSITESWRGTTFGSVPGSGRRWKQGEDKEIRSVFTRFFGNNSSTQPLALGISGDQTQHLLWRMQNGEFPSSNATRIFVVLIGTNNLGAGMLPPDTIRGIDAVGRYILQQQQQSHGNSYLLLSEILPRFDSHRLARLCPPRCNKDGEPFKSFLPAIDKVNKGLPWIVKQWRDDFSSQKVAISSCGSSLFTQDNFPQVMPDQLHPNALGHERWAKCLSKHIERLMNQEALPLVLNE